MSNLRKNLHLSYKEKMVHILLLYTADMSGDLPSVASDPEGYITNWVNANFLPMGDFDKEQAIKEVEEWSE